MYTLPCLQKININFIGFCTIFSLLFISRGNEVIAQKNELGFSVGTLSYRGEISPSFSLVHARPAGSLFYRRNFNPYITLRLGITFGLLHADEENSSNPLARARNAALSGFLTEAALSFEYNFLNYIVNYRERGNLNKFTPYLTGGLGFFNPQINTKSIDQDVETKSKPALLIGLGFKYMLGQQWNIGAELVARKTFTDRLDGISETYIDNKLFGDPINSDYYYYIGLTLSYTFYKIHCPSKR